MKRALACVLLVSSLSACDRHASNATSRQSEANDAARRHRKEMRLTYHVPAAVTKEAGHQAYLFGETWASSREDIIHHMAQAGWNLVPDQKSSDPTIRFYSNSPGPMTGQPDGIRWERD